MCIEKVKLVTNQNLLNDQLMMIMFVDYLYNIRMNNKFKRTSSSSCLTNCYSYSTNNLPNLNYIN